MPNLVGKTLKAALELLEYAGFTNVKYDVYVENDAPKDQIVFQSVEMDQEIPLNTKIELKLSTGPAATKPVSFDVIEKVEPYQIIIARKDTGEVVFQGNVESGVSKITVNLTGRGMVTYVITMDGTAQREEKVDFETP